MGIPESTSIEQAAGDAAIGAAAGVAATVLMTGVMEAAQRLGLMGDMPPWVITRRTLEKSGKRHKVSTPAQKLLATAMHVGFGAILGAIYEAVEDEAQPPGPKLAHVLGYSVAVWAVSYAGWVPALGLMPPPTHDQKGRQLATFAAHIVFGAALLAAAEGLRRVEEQVQVQVQAQGRD